MLTTDHIAQHNPLLSQELSHVETIHLGGINNRL